MINQKPKKKKEGKIKTGKERGRKSEQRESGPCQKFTQNL